MTIPDRFELAAAEIELNANREKRQLTVSNTGDRAIQVGSHYHFFEANRALRFDRAAAFGMHLDVPAGTAVRFEPGDTHEVALCAYGGTELVRGFNGLVQGGVRSEVTHQRALRRLRERDFLDSGEGSAKANASGRAKGTTRTKSATRSKSAAKAKGSTTAKGRKKGSTTAKGRKR